jgi:hypothetical protein
MGAVPLKKRRACSTVPITAALPANVSVAHAPRIIPPHSVRATSLENIVKMGSGRRGELSGKWLRRVRLLSLLVQGYL